MPSPNGTGSESPALPRGSASTRSRASGSRVNGHEYLKRQLAKVGIAFDALDDGLLICADAACAHHILDDPRAETIAPLVAKWLGRFLDTITVKDHRAGSNVQLSILRVELSRTLVFDRPLAGRHLSETVLCENHGLGRPETVSLIFNRRITQRTPGTFHTRVIMQGVIRSLHVSSMGFPVVSGFSASDGSPAW